LAKGENEMANFLHRIAESLVVKPQLLHAFLALSIGFLVLSCQLGDVTGIFASPGDHYQQGLQATQQGDWDKARTEFDAAKDYQDARQRALDAQQKSATVSTAYDRAMKAINEQDWWTAYSQLDIVLKLSPNYRDARDKSSQAQQKLESIFKDADQKLEASDFDGAIASYKKAGGYKLADQKASSLASTKANLDQLYGQMTANAASGKWDVALTLSGQILATFQNYRDVQAKRTEYFEQVYSSASTALSQKNYREAVRLFGIIVAADKNYKDSNEKLGAAQVALRKAVPGIYPINRQVANDGTFILTLSNIEVLSDGKLRVTVNYRNNSSSTAETQCPNDADDDAEKFLRLSDGKRVFPLQTLCTSQRGKVTRTAPGGTYDSWATYPQLEDVTKPFDLVWRRYEVKGIVLSQP
jgi:outer membrane protein assembly factor BamD (BamD/ComL family)